MDLKKLVKDYLPLREVMHLATLKDGKPRLVSVHFAFDEELNIYWVSSRNSQHSQDLRTNKATAVAVLIDEDKRKCIHFEGEAFELEGDETRKADEIYGKKFGISKDRLEAALRVKKDNPAYYLFKPSHITLIDPTTFPDAPKQELKI
jgi:uncharacterized protein YhbP (UPF0306 family)